MNCQQGDLAEVVGRIPGSCGEQFLGAIVQCSELGYLQDWATGDFVPAWRFAEPLRCRNCPKGLVALPDEMLKPLPKPEEVEAFDRAEPVREAGEVSFDEVVGVPR